MQVCREVLPTGKRKNYEPDRLQYFPPSVWIAASRTLGVEHGVYRDEDVHACDGPKDPLPGNRRTLWSCHPAWIIGTKGRFSHHPFHSYSFRKGEFD
ncbi:hypothetical protein [Peribacillus acanthi]|uniref:hypothetical protein n=1 Tax=Peribacillus acanthi TaxID=2171554 RepID=UPI0013001741|nr:hypothetical protein [Peribacillus acanthi]